jgi:dienelactone hydrolase
MDDLNFWSRREVVRTVAGTALSGALYGGALASSSGSQSTTPADRPSPSMIGGYGNWAANLVSQPYAKLSYLQSQFQDLDAWRKLARSRLMECLQQPVLPPIRDVRVDSAFEFDGLAMERVSWQLAHGPRTKALMIKPKSYSGKLPAVLGLHDHGGLKYFGHEKITRSSEVVHPTIRKHQAKDYGDLAWANELAKRGYAVLTHDTFAFASRRVKMDDVSEPARRKRKPVDDDSEESVSAYHEFAGEHENIMAKSLFCAGTTWPGVFTAEDQRALDYLCSRPEVDADRIGCAGLSGGGLRTVYLGGLDDRIRCACCVGMMTTWRDYLLYKCHTHTWMIYIPLLPLDLDYPEILGLRVPLPTMVLNNNQDPLFSLPEMQRADQLLRDSFRKANASDKYACRFYDGPHKFDAAMQKDAFDWFDRWLKA